MYNSIKFDYYIDSNDKKLNEWKKVIKSTCNIAYPSSYFFSYTMPKNK